MTVHRVIVGGLGTNCYILESNGTALIIDPGDEAEKILERLGDLETLRILATHRHSDHISALGKVKKVLRKKAAIHRLDWVAGFDEELHDGQSIEFGGEELSVIHTPGHTPGGCCFLVGDVLISGDTLFPNGPGNTSFPGGDEKAIRRSIRDKLMVLPDRTVVYPGHGPETTIGKERRLY
ncbi:MAG: MBL fold metallo-hydrolase [candidate division WOR-3 bacterium]|nr:MAG: MBL fold metallo-hydrolase [candidate division WOR-3 bacterium]